MEDAVGLAQSGIRALDDRLQIATASREAGAQVVQDQAEAVGERLAHDVVDAVDVHFLAVVLNRQELLASARLPGGDHLERRGRLGARSMWLRGLAVHILLTQK